MGLQSVVDLLILGEVDAHLLAHAAHQPVQQHLYLGPVLFQVRFRRHVLGAGQQDRQRVHLARGQPHRKALFQRPGQPHRVHVLLGGFHQGHVGGHRLHGLAGPHAHQRHRQGQGEHAEGIVPQPLAQLPLLHAAHQLEQGGQGLVTEQPAGPALHHVGASGGAPVQSGEVHVLLQQPHAAVAQGLFLPLQGAALAHLALQAHAAAQQVCF